MTLNGILSNKQKPADTYSCELERGEHFFWRSEVLEYSMAMHGLPARAAGKKHHLFSTPYFARTFVQHGHARCRAAPRAMSVTSQLGRLQMRRMRSCRCT